LGATALIGTVWVFGGPSCRSWIGRDLTDRRAALKPRRCRIWREVWRVQIIFAAGEGKQGVASGIGERSSHPVWGGYFADLAHRPIRGDPFTEDVEKGGRELDQPGLGLNPRGLTVAISYFVRHLRPISSALASDA
jgi:hypothetical protein